MSKAQLSAALVLVAMFGLPVAAKAATPAAQPYAAAAIFAEHGDDGGDDGGDGGEADGNSGGTFTAPDTTPANPKDKDDSFVVPPVVVNPAAKKTNPLGKAPSKTTQVDSKTQPVVDLPQNHPIQVDKVQPSTKTPTDLFVDTAVIGLGAVGAGALGLGAMVGVRAIRSRKAGAKADYFYGD